MMNSWDAAKVSRREGHPGVFISYRPAQVYGSGWGIISITEQTDPTRIHNGGTRIFPGRHTLQQAMDWATERYGVTDWVKIPGFRGDYFPAAAEPAIKAALKADKAKTK